MWPASPGASHRECCQTLSCLDGLSIVKCGSNHGRCIPCLAKGAPMLYLHRSHPALSTEYQSVYPPSGRLNFTGSGFFQFRVVNHFTAAPHRGTPHGPTARVPGCPGPCRANPMRITRFGCRKRLSTCDGPPKVSKKKGPRKTEW